MGWRRLRWLAFLFAIVIDGLVFYFADPFTPRSFLASGLAAILLFLLFIEIAMRFRGKGRVRRALVGGEEVRYEAGQHLLALLRNIREHKAPRRAICWPLLISLLATAAIFALFLIEIGLMDVAWSPLAAMQYACGAFISLLIAIPYAVEKVSEWRSRQYVVVVDAKSYEPRLLIHRGVFNYRLRTVSIERVVTTTVIQNWWESLIAYGDVELRETAGGEGEMLESIWLPRRLEREVRMAIKGSRWRPQD